MRALKSTEGAGAMEKAKPLGLFEWTHKDMKREGMKATGIGSSSGLRGYHM